MRFLQAFILGFVLFTLSCVSFAADDESTSPYASKLKRCVQANINGTARSITDFICAETQDQGLMLSQIVEDEQFKVIQTQAIQFLEALEQDVQTVSEDPDKALDDLVKNFGPQGAYFELFRAECNGGILAKMSESQDIPNTTAADFIGNSVDGNSCMARAQVHLDGYLFAGTQHIQAAKGQAINDSYKKYTQEMDGPYSGLLDMMQKILVFIERIKPVFFIKNPL